MADPDVSPPVWLLSVQATTKRPVARVVTTGANWLFRVVALIRNSAPAGAPSFEKTCPRMALPDTSPPVWLPSLQTTTKPPPSSLLIAGADWELKVVVLIRNSGPEGVPVEVNIWPRMAVPVVSPPVWLLSVQATTKRPSDNVVIVGADWAPLVVVLIRNSEPDRVPSAMKTCPRMAASEVSPPVALRSVQTTTNLPPERAEISGLIWSFTETVLIWNALPPGVPSAWKTRPKTLICGTLGTPTSHSSSSLRYSSRHVTTKRPSPSVVIEGSNSRLKS